MDDDPATPEPPEADQAAIQSPAAAGSSLVRRVSRLLEAVGALVAIVALVVLGINSAIRLNLRWDTFWYHLPFAAEHGGLRLSYVMNDEMLPRYEGFPPLPEFVQGLLWRATGSMNATGVVNFLAFALFLIYCHRLLRAPFWLVALISLTAPMVLIHTTVSYVDLFGNAFLAIGLASCLSFYLLPERPSRAIFVGGCAALAAAAWSKYLLVPVVGVGFLFFAVIVLRSHVFDRVTRRNALAILFVFAALAAAPYAKNLVAYGNPFWPTKVPIVGSLFPYLSDDVVAGTTNQRPPDLATAPQVQVFVESLFETRNPVHYPNRARWIIDQGNTLAAFRMGGFWGVGVVIYLVVTFGMLILYRRRAGLIVSVTGVIVLGIVAVLPQSNELRYYMFIPLTWAATIGMLYRPLGLRFPRAAIGLLVLVFAMFGHMVAENQDSYQIRQVDYRDAAVAWGAAKWWPILKTGPRYCVVDMTPIGILMTGPTMHEYTIIDRTKVELCPRDSIVITTAGIQGPYRPN